MHNARLSPYEEENLRSRELLPVEPGLPKPKRDGRHSSELAGLALPLTLLAILAFRDRALALLNVPWIAPVLALAILTVGIPMARRSRRPRISLLSVFGSVFVLACFWFGPGFVVPWIPSMLPMVMVVLVMFVLPDAHSFHDPGQFRVGVYMMAGAVATFWPAQAWIAGLDLGFKEYNVVLHVVALLLSVCMFLGGAYFVRTANDSVETDSAVPHCPECESAKVHVTLRSINGVHYCCDSCDHLWIA